MVAFALPVDVTGEITVSGQVTVNGQPAVSNSTILSGAVITAAKGSSAVVSLGKLGRVEVQSETTVTLRFTDNSFVTMLDTGKVRVSNSSGISNTVTTKTATFIGDVAQANNYLVEVDCSNAFLTTTSGLVTMREGTSNKQVAAGSGTVSCSADTAQTGCKPCLRPDSAPGPAIAGLPLLLLLAAGAAGLGIYFGTRDDDTDLGGGTVIVSPVR